MNRFKLIIGLFLTPFSLLYGLVAFVRRLLYRTGILHGEDSPVPAIDIGNLAVGGTGKTPHTQYVINLLKQNFHVASLSRGYGRKSKGYQSILMASEESRISEIFGDEPLMTHYRFPDIPLAVDGDRCEGVRRLLFENPETEVVVLDDAYQHLRFRSSFHILLTEYGRPFRPDMPMPCGRLREFPSASRYADAVVVTKVPDNVSTLNEGEWRRRLRLETTQPLFFTRFRYAPPRPVTQASRQLNLGSLRDIVLLTGIAHPEPLLLHLKKSFNIVSHYEFPDHHIFSEREIQHIYTKHFDNIGGHCVLFTTEKDWMRLQSDHVINIVSLLAVFVIPVDVVFLTENQKNTFNQIVIDHVRGKKKKGWADRRVSEQP